MASIWTVVVAIGLWATPTGSEPSMPPFGLTVLQQWVSQPSAPVSPRILPFEVTLSPGRVTSFMLEGAFGDGLSLQIQGISPSLQALQAVNPSTGKALSVGQDGRFWGIEASGGPVIIGVTTLGLEPVRVLLSPP